MDIDSKEIERRESYLRANFLPFSWIDPFTWKHRYRLAALGAASTAGLGYIYNIYSKKPWYYGKLMVIASYDDCCCFLAGGPRFGIIILSSAVCYAVGAFREHQYTTRDAVVWHYMQLHPADFERVHNGMSTFGSFVVNGRGFCRNILKKLVDVQRKYANLSSLIT